ncbi:4166_t:CDS:2 [Entrophospora sp. SA101]|nr:9821_t:CDS:2 [Entrophospora sp. SA101]CAJ0758648.1 4166_t:CDS:2 [Entrophospora sp. SA101]
MELEKSERFIIFYASQTGNSEWIAKNIHKEALEHGYSNECFVCDDYEKVDFTKEKVLIFVTANTGDGDPPDNSIKFFRFLRKTKSKTFLSHAKFTILGLGDTNYSNFNNTAKRLEKKLLEIGATTFYEKGLADDATGLEAIVDPWISNLWLALPNVYLSDIDKHEQLTALPRIPATICKIIKKKIRHLNPLKSLPSFIINNLIMYAKLDTVCCLSHPDALKRTLHLELDVKEFRDKIEFVPGDSFGIYAPNSIELIKGILSMLEINEQEFDEEISVESLEEKDLPSHLKNANSTSIIELLSYGVDLCSSPRKALLRMMAEYVSDENEKKTLLFLCSKQAPTFLDLLTTFPSCKPPFERILDILPPHQPRYYSITNSPLSICDKLHIAFNVAEYDTPSPYNMRKYGVCTPWLDNLTGVVTEMNKPVKLSSDIRIPIFIKPNTNQFAVPSDISKPVIMIGPGTGVAPFVGFLQHREQILSVNPKEVGKNNNDILVGDMWLFYGCRNKEIDFIYRKELEGFLERGILKELLVSESRVAGAGIDGKPKYVQDLIRKYGNDLYDLLDKKNAMIFICGDAKGMSKDVNDALVDILIEHGKMDRPEAIKLLQKWMSEKRYLRDLWA